MYPGRADMIKQELRRSMHQPIPQQGRWLQQVVTGYFNFLPYGHRRFGPWADIAPIKQRYLSGSLAAVGEAAVAIECETEMRS